MRNITRVFSVATLLLALSACGADGEVAEVAQDGEFDRFAATGKFDANGVEEHSFEAACVLNLANRASQRELDDDVGLFRSAAKGIVRWRSGADGVDKTADDKVFTNLDQLDGVSWVGWFAFRAMKSYAIDNSYCPQLAEETPPPAWAAR